MGNDASRVDVCRGSLVRARVWARGRSKVILLHWCRDQDHWLLRKRRRSKGGECNGYEMARGAVPPVEFGLLPSCTRPFQCVYSMKQLIGIIRLLA